MPGDYDALQRLSNVKDNQSQAERGNDQTDKISYITYICYGDTESVIDMTVY